MTGICTCGELKVKKAGTRLEDGHEVCNACHRSIEHTPLTRATAAEPVAPRLSTRTLAREADNLITLAFGAGLGAMVLGLLVVAATWPDGESGSGASDAGNGWLAFLGAALAGAGQLAVLFAIIAWAVKTGIQASRRD